MISLFSRSFICSLLLVVLLIPGSAWPQQGERDIGVSPTTPGGEFKALYGTSWAVVIGINDYPRPEDRLEFAVADAEEMIKILPQLGFPPEQIIVLRDKEATKARIEQVLYRQLRQTLKEEDRLVIFFAGHGKQLKLPKGGEEAFLMPVDASPDTPEETGIPMADMEKIGRRLKAKHILFVLDACYSGFVFGKTRATWSPQPSAFLAEATRDPVIQALTAGKTGQKALEKGGHGIFTRSLIEGLRGAADQRNKGFITATDLLAWAQENVSNDSGGRQLPQGGRLFGEGEFIFLRPGVQLAAATPPPPSKVIVVEKPQLGSLGVAANVQGVEVWLNDRWLGKTQLGKEMVVDNLQVGSYQLLARKGTRSWKRQVDIVADRKMEIRIETESVLRESIKVEDDEEAKPVQQRRVPMVIP
jgi:uncharacterized caspase-like protein